MLLSHPSRHEKKMDLGSLILCHSLLTRIGNKSCIYEIHFDAYFCTLQFGGPTCMKHLKNKSIPYWRGVVHPWNWSIIRHSGWSLSSPQKCFIIGWQKQSLTKGCASNDSHDKQSLLISSSSKCKYHCCNIRADTIKTRLACEAEGGLLSLHDSLLKGFTHSMSLCGQRHSVCSPLVESCLWGLAHVFSHCCHLCIKRGGPRGHNPFSEQGQKHLPLTRSNTPLKS